MKIPNIKIDENMFYTIGKYCFLFIATANLIGLIQGINQGLFQAYQIVSQSFSIFFNFAVAGFFSYLKNKFSIPASTSADLDELTKLLEEQNADVREKERNAKN